MCAVTDGCDRPGTIVVDGERAGTGMTNIMACRQCAENYVWWSVWNARTPLRAQDGDVAAFRPFRITASHAEKGPKLALGATQGQGCGKAILCASQRAL